MVSILDNKKIADLVIEKPESEEGYEKINPKSLATIIYERHEDDEPTEITPDVQQHIDNKNIHFTKEGFVEELNNKYLQPESVVGKGDIVVSYDEETKELSIETDVPSFDSYMKRGNLHPQDETITLTPIPGTENDVYIRANIPDVTNFLVSTNVRAADDTIFVSRDQYSNNVYIKANPINYQAGEGLKIVDGVITNTMPDKVVGLIEGDNISIDSNYPNFTISARNKLNVTPWQADFKYVYGDVIIHNNGIYYCNVSESEKSAFDYLDWQVIADYKMTKQNFVSPDTPTQILDLRNYEFLSPITDTDTVIINVGGIIPLSDTYRIRADGYTIEFIDEPIPANTPIEIMVLGHSVLNEQDPTANINEWEPNVVYEVGNIVIYEDALYKCIERHPSEEEFDVSKWHILMSYTKDVYPFVFEEDVSSIILPNKINSKEDITINVGNTTLLNSSYEIGDDGKTINFNSPIEAGINIEVSVYTHGVLSIPEIPNPNGRKDVFLKSNNTGTAYETISKVDLLRLLGLYTITQIERNSGSVIGVNNAGTDYEFIPNNQLSARVKLRNTTNGFDVLNADEVRNKRTNNMITFSRGSTLSNDESILMATYQTITKDFSAKWERGSNKGSLIDTDYQDIVWNSARDMVISIDSPAEKKLRVTTTAQQSDREGWRAMDAYKVSGNGWQALTSNAVWQYANGYSDDYKPLKITRFKFRNQKLDSRSKDIDLWISNDTGTDNLTTKEKIKVGSFRAYNNYTQEYVVDIANPQYGKVFGFDVKNSYGGGIGAMHVEMEGYIGATMLPDARGYIYIISNDEGNYTDIATSYHGPDEVAEHLPQGYTKFKQLGIFQTDENSQIWDVYPLEDLNTFYINRNFVNQDQLSDILYNYDDMIEDKINTLIDEVMSGKDVYTQSEIDEKFTTEINARQTADDGKVDKVSSKNKIYGTNASGNQTTYDKNSFGTLDNILINNTISGTVNDKVAAISLTASDVGAAASSHTHGSNNITKMTSYSKPSTTSAISASDSLNTAIGKLEKNFDNKVTHKDVATRVYGTDANKSDTTYDMETLAKKLFNYIYPVGSIYITYKNKSGSNSLDPNTVFGGTWSLVASGKAIWTGNGSNGNTTISAGLPNIIGTFQDGNEYGSNDQLSGAFYRTTSSGHTTWDGNSSPNRVGFDANAGAKAWNSASDGIYGNSTTVQPPAIVLNVWKRTG